MADNPKILFTQDGRKRILTHLQKHTNNFILKDGSFAKKKGSKLSDWDILETLVDVIERSVEEKYNIST